jgi:coenzyme PQQ biosynthesis protein PqqD
VNDDAAPRFGKGVKLRHDRDGSVMLLVPEGVLVLNRAAACALENVDGKRTLGQIVEIIVERFDVTPERAREDLHGLFDRLRDRGLVR